MPFNPSKIIHILIGPKGSGKTYIGSILESRLGIKFLRVEPIWLSLKADENGWNKVESKIDDILLNENEIIIESLGIGGFPAFKQSLESKYCVRLIRIITGLDECLRRVKSRDQSIHIPVSDNKVFDYNNAARQVEFEWSAQIDNNGPATVDQIIKGFMVA